MENSESKPKTESWMASKAFLAIFGALFALIFIVFIVVINVATQMEDIEEKLLYVPPQTSGQAIPEESAVAGQTIYVPVYSHIYYQGGKPFLLESTLSIRNSDPGKDITVNSVRYYNTEGKLVKNYLEKPLRLNPLATVEYLVEQKKIEGGSGANFIVEWVSDTRVNRPVIETVMVGVEGQASVSFVRSGIEISNY